jgi:hypothetical protein
MIFEKVIVLFDEMSVVGVESEKLVFVSNNSLLKSCFTFDGFCKHVFLSHKFDSLIFASFNFLATFENLVLF